MGGDVRRGVCARTVFEAALALEGVAGSGSSVIGCCWTISDVRRRLEGNGNGVELTARPSLAAPLAFPGHLRPPVIQGFIRTAPSTELLAGGKVIEDSRSLISDIARPLALRDKPRTNGRLV